MGTTGDQVWLIVGRAAKPHGIHGDILVEVITDFPERLAVGVTFGLGPVEGPETFHEAHAVRIHKGRWLLGVKGVRSREPVESWRGRYLFLPEQAPDELPEGFFYEHHLVGLECRSPEGEVLGSISGLDPDESQTRVIVKKDAQEFLVPWVPAIIRSVDLENRIVVIDAPPGLLDDRELSS